MLYGRTADDLSPLAAFQRLRALDLDHFDVVGSRRLAITTLAALGLPALRELSLPWTSDLAPIAAAHGARLELFESPQRAVELAPMVAGATLASRSYPMRQLPVAATISTHEPWLIRNVIEYEAY